MTLEIPGYTLKREIGSGGMASVYLAVQDSLDRRIALKVMSPALVADRTFTKRFLREAKTVAALNHRNIVSVYDVGVTEERLHYFSMEFLPNGDFADRIKRGTSQPEIIRVLIAIATALGFAHEQGYVHRDVKPGNILFDPTDTPVLSDFGIARAATNATRMTGTGVSVGTSHYMSPEQARGKEVDGRSDLYSLGVVAFEALAGRTPFDGEDGFAIAYSHVFDPVPKLPDAVAEWQPFIDRALAKRPDERFQNAPEFIEAVRAMKAGKRVLPREHGPGHATTPVPAVGAVHKRSFAQQWAVARAMLRGLPGSRRFEAQRKVDEWLSLGFHHWRLGCHRVFSFLRPTYRPIAGVVSVFLLVALLAIGLRIRTDDAPSPAIVAEPVLDAADRPVNVAESGLSDDESVPMGDVDARVAGEPAVAEVIAQPVDAAPDLAEDVDPGLDAVDERMSNAEAGVERPAMPVESPAEAVGDQTSGDGVSGSEALGDGAADDDVAVAQSSADSLQGVPEAFPGGEVPGDPVVATSAQGLDGEVGDEPEFDVEAVLALAAQDLAEDRLTTPADSNAFDRYTSILDRAPDNIPARDGLSAIVDRYFILSRAATGRGDFLSAVRLLERAERVGERSSAPQRIDDVRDRLVPELREAVARADRVGSSPLEALQALQRLLPDDARVSARIDELMRAPEPVRSFRDELTDGTSGPRMIVVDLAPYEIDTGGTRISIGERRSLAMSATEITVEEFGRFVRATRHYSTNRMAPCRERDSAWRASRRRNWEEPGFAQSDDHPVVCVTWEDAAAMATWLSSETGFVYRLPTETEWEFLAQQVPAAGATPCETDNVGDIWLKAQESGRDVVACEDGWAFTAPVVAFPLSPEGFGGLHGNVREWAVDCWNEPRSAASTSFAPLLTGDCGKRVVKGTSWYDGSGFDQVTTRFGFGDDDAYNTVGFRVVRVVDEASPGR